MSLDFTLMQVQETEVYSRNITHNLGKMAAEAGIYEALWRPEEINCDTAQQIIPLLEKGLEDLRARPDHYEKFSSPNGWGTYEHFVPFVESVLAACKEYPHAKISICR